LLTWLSRVEEGYVASNSYHNALHAADVVACVDYFLRQPKMEQLLGQMDMLCAVSRLPLP
jgi:hypothetical protein